MAIPDVHRSDFTAVEFMAEGGRSQSWTLKAVRPNRLGDDTSCLATSHDGAIPQSRTTVVMNSHPWTGTNNDSLTFDSTHQQA